ncbi:MAG: tyrosine-type recombinase/integrase [Fusobacterium gastrosuis]|uniref:tyrosine-type recombinase/integrase n=1 Tax=Fusobacterium gastrosuis TaxID=1755100 RepID=UPI002A8BFD85|nr:tyrosine-type recombinase/integrase [Fusobacterium gastrosuis]
MRKILKDFIYYLEFKENKKYNTIISLKNDLEQFINYFAEKEIDDIKKIDYLLLREYYNFLKNANFSIASFNRKLSSIKKLYKYLKEINFIDENISILLENLKPELKEIEYLTKDEIEKIRMEIDGNNFNSIRDKFIFELMYSSGITVAELLSLGEKNFLIEEREIQFFKGKKKKYLFFSERCKKVLNEYVSIKKEKFKDKNNEDILFVNNSNQRMTDRSIRRIISKYSEKAGIKKEVSPYTIRHTFCVIMLKNGMPKEYLKHMLDISNIDLLSGYERSIRKESL